METPLYVQNTCVSYLRHRKSGLVSQVSPGRDGRILVDVVELLHGLSGRRLEAVECLLAVPDRRRRLMSTAYSVFVNGKQRSGPTHRLHTPHSARQAIFKLLYKIE